MWQFYFQIFGKPTDLFPMLVHKFTLPPTVYKTFTFTTSKSIFVVICAPDDGHSDWDEMEFYSGFISCFHDI